MKNKLLSILAAIIMVITANAQIPTADLVAHYDFSSGALTDNINGANFTKVGAAATTITDRFGLVDQAISLNGDHLNRADIDFSTTSGYRPRTISFWLKTSTNDNYEREIYNDNDRSSITDAIFDGIRVFLKNGKIVSTYSNLNNAGVYNTHSKDISDNVWHHVVIEAYSLITTGPNKLVLPVYIDGVKEGGTTISAVNLNAFIGGQYTGDMSFSGLGSGTFTVPANNKYQDGIDEVLVYKKVLTDAEIEAIAKNNGYAHKVYVNKTATGNNDGTSWANAYTSLFDCLNNITGADKDVWVAKGTYKPHVSDRDVSFVMNTNIYGGFAGTEILLSDRDISLIHSTNATILSGDLSSNDNATVGFNDSTRNDNSKHVIEVTTNNLELNGVTIQDGHANSTTGDDRFGAGVFKEISITHLTVKNCVIKNNVALTGAGLFLTCNDSSNMKIDACIIQNNLANQAAGIEYYMSTQYKNMFITITNSLFNGNKTDDNGGVKGSGAAAIRLRSYNVGTGLSTTIVNNTFVNNSSKGTAATAGDYPVVGISKLLGTFTATNVSNNIFWGNVTNSNATAKAIGKSSSAYISFGTDGQVGVVQDNTDEDGLSNFTNGAPSNTSTVDPNLDANFKLTAGSLAINSGRNIRVPAGIILDLAGNERIFNVTVDRGAYEFGSNSNFVRTLTITSPNGIVTANPSPINGTYINGTIVVLTVVPNTAAQFIGWSGDASGLSLTTTILMDADKSVTAMSQTSGTIYVDKTATGNNDGSTWANAYTSLSQALTSATANNDVWVAKGTFKPHASDRDASFLVNSNIYGGFAGTEINLSERDLSLIHTTNETVLSGDLDNDDATTVDFNDTTRDDNSQHVVEIATNNLEINGFTIKDGNANGSGDDRFGAGIFKERAVDNITIKNCVLKNNVASYSGAGLSITSQDSSIIIIDACIIENNLSPVGAGLDYHMSTPDNTMNITITNSLFNGNKTDDNAVTIKGTGASAARFRAYYSDVILTATLVNNTFVNNSSKGDLSNSAAGNFPVVGLSEDSGSFGNIRIANNIFWGNVTNGNALAWATGKTAANIAVPISYTFLDNNTDESNQLSSNNTNPNLDANFKLTTASTIEINGGDNNQIPSGFNKDLAGSQRVFNTTVDRGAYEFGSSDPLGVDNFFVEDEFSIYPNPTRSILNIKMDSNLKRATIYSTLGTKVLETTSKNIATSNLKKGFYLIKIEGENGSISTKRFVKQ